MAGIKFGLRFKSNHKAVISQVEKESKKRIVQIAALIEAKAKISLDVEAPTVTGPDGGEMRIGSTPPKPPHKRLGILANSIKFELKRGGLSAIVGPTVSYGKVHEFGGRNHAARPFMRPAFRSIRQKFRQIFKGLL